MWKSVWSSWSNLESIQMCCFSLFLVGVMMKRHDKRFSLSEPPTTPFSSKRNPNLMGLSENWFLQTKRGSVTAEMKEHDFTALNLWQTGYPLVLNSTHTHAFDGYPLVARYQQCSTTNGRWFWSNPWTTSLTCKIHRTRHLADDTRSTRQ